MEISAALLIAMFAYYMSFKIKEKNERDSRRLSENQPIKTQQQLEQELLELNIKKVEEDRWKKQVEYEFKSKQQAKMALAKSLLPDYAQNLIPETLFRDNSFTNKEFLVLRFGQEAYDKSYDFYIEKGLSRPVLQLEPEPELSDIMKVIYEVYGVNLSYKEGEVLVDPNKELNLSLDSDIGAKVYK